MDSMNEKLVEYRQVYKDLQRALARLNVMTFNEPYRSHFQAFGKDLAQHDLVLNAVMGLDQPPPLMFMNYERQTGSAREQDDLGVKVPIPAYLAQFSISRDYQEDGDE